MALPTRKIGDADVPTIGFGAMGIAAHYGPVEPDEERFKVLDAAYARGCTHFDSANVYGDSEVLIGKWLKRTGNRKNIFLATKFGVNKILGGSSKEAIRGDPPYVRECIETSLSRLGVDYVDLYYLHRIDPNTPIEVTVGAMAELVKEGKVRYLGLSECSAAALRRAHAVHPISAVQVEYSPFFLDPEDPKIGLLQTTKELGITLVAYSPLGRGFLTGRYKSHDDLDPTDWRRCVPKYSNENFPKILEVVSQIEAIGARHNATPGQVALAWVLAQSDNIVTIPGTKKIKYLNENIDASFLKLSPEEIAAVRKIAEESDIPGTRYPAAGMGSVLIDSPELSQ